MLGGKNLLTNLMVERMAFDQRFFQAGLPSIRIDIEVSAPLGDLTLHGT